MNANTYYYSSSPASHSSTLASSIAQTQVPLLSARRRVHFKTESDTRQWTAEEVRTGGRRERPGNSDGVGTSTAHVTAHTHHQPRSSSVSSRSGSAGSSNGNIKRNNNRNTGNGRGSSAITTVLNRSGGGDSHGSSAHPRLRQNITCPQSQSIERQQVTAFVIFSPQGTRPLESLIIEAASSSSRGKERSTPAITAVAAAPGRLSRTSRVDRTSGVRCLYDRDTHSQVLYIPPNTDVSFLKDIPTTQGTSNAVLALQVCGETAMTTSGGSAKLDPTLELTVADRQGTRRRILLTGAASSIAVTAQHVRMPLKCIREGRWVNLFLDVSGLYHTFWPENSSAGTGAPCRLKQAKLHANTRGVYVRRVLGMSAMPHLGTGSHASAAASGLGAHHGGGGSVLSAITGFYRSEEVCLPESLRLPLTASEASISVLVETGHESALASNIDALVDDGSEAEMVTGVECMTIEVEEEEEKPLMHSSSSSSPRVGLRREYPAMVGQQPGSAVVPEKVHAGADAVVRRNDSAGSHSSGATSPSSLRERVRNQNKAARSQVIAAQLQSKLRPAVPMGLLGLPPRREGAPSSGDEPPQSQKHTEGFFHDDTRGAVGTSSVSVDSHLERGEEEEEDAAAAVTLSAMEDDYTDFISYNDHPSRFAGRHHGADDYYHDAAASPSSSDHGSRPWTGTTLAVSSASASSVLSRVASPVQQQIEDEMEVCAVNEANLSPPPPSTDTLAAAASPLVSAYPVASSNLRQPDRPHLLVAHQQQQYQQQQQQQQDRQFASHDAVRAPEGLQGVVDGTQPIASPSYTSAMQVVALLNARVRSIRSVLEDPHRPRPASTPAPPRIPLYALSKLPTVREREDKGSRKVKSGGDAGEGVGTLQQRAATAQVPRGPPALHRPDSPSSHFPLPASLPLSVAVLVEDKGVQTDIATAPIPPLQQWSPSTHPLSDGVPRAAVSPARHPLLEAQRQLQPEKKTEKQDENILELWRSTEIPFSARVQEEREAGRVKDREGNDTAHVHPHHNRHRHHHHHPAEFISQQQSTFPHVSMWSEGVHSAGAAVASTTATATDTGATQPHGLMDLLKRRQLAPSPKSSLLPSPISGLAARVVDSRAPMKLQVLPQASHAEGLNSSNRNSPQYSMIPQNNTHGANVPADGRDDDDTGAPISTNTSWTFQSASVIAASSSAVPWRHASYPSDMTGRVGEAAAYGYSSHMSSVQLPASQQPLQGPGQPIYSRPATAAGGAHDSVRVTTPLQSARNDRHGSTSSFYGTAALHTQGGTLASAGPTIESEGTPLPWPVNAPRFTQQQPLSAVLPPSGTSRRPPGLPTKPRGVVTAVPLSLLGITGGAAGRLGREQSRIVAPPELVQRPVPTRILSSLPATTDGLSDGKEGAAATSPPQDGRGEMETEGSEGDADQPPSNITVYSSCGTFMCIRPSQIPASASRRVRYGSVSDSMSDSVPQYDVNTGTADAGESIHGVRMLDSVPSRRHCGGTEAFPWQAHTPSQTSRNGMMATGHDAADGTANCNADSKATRDGERYVYDSVLDCYLDLYTNEYVD